MFGAGMKNVEFSLSLTLLFLGQMAWKAENVLEELFEEKKLKLK